MNGGKDKKILQRIWESGKFRFAAGAALLVLIWWVAAAAVNRQFILPSPWAALSAVPQVLGSRLFLQKVGATVWRTLKGFLLSFTAGAALAAASLRKPVEDFMRPVIGLLRSIPTLILTVLFLVWFSKDEGPVVIGMMMTFPVIYTGLLAALKNVDKNLLEMARLYEVPRRKIYSVIYLRSTLPYVFSTAETALGMSFKVVVSAEVLIFPALAVGKEIFILQQQFLYNAQVFAWILIVLVIIFILEGVIALLKRAFIRW